MCLAQGPQRSDAGEAQTRGSSVLSQALYHWATALPHDRINVFDCPLSGAFIISLILTKRPLTHVAHIIQDKNYLCFSAAKL